METRGHQLFDLNRLLQCRGYFVTGVLCCAGGIAFWAGFNARAQQASIKDFKAALESFPPPNEMQPKTILEGDTAELVSNRNQWFLLTGVKLTMFNTNGTVSMVAETPQCYFDSANRIVTSSNRLKIQRADGSLTMEGDGFLLQQTNFNLIISNNVHTFIRYAPGQALTP